MAFQSLFLPQATGTLIFWFTLRDFDEGFPTRGFGKGPLRNSFYTVQTSFNPKSPGSSGKGSVDSAGDRGGNQTLNRGDGNAMQSYSIHKSPEKTEPFNVA